MARRDDVLVDVGGRQIDGGAEIGVHGALAVGRDEDDRARGRRSVERAGGVSKRTPCALEVVGEDLAAAGRPCTLPKKAASPAEGSDAGRRIGRRAAGDLRRRPHVDRKARAPSVSSMSRIMPLVRPCAGEEIVLDAGEHIDDGIADGEHIEIRLVSWKPLEMSGRDGEPYRIDLAPASRAAITCGRP